MNSWIHLLKKEIRLGVPAFLIPIIAFVVLVGIAFYFGNRKGYGFEAAGGVALVALGMQVWYLVYYLFYSLQAEKKKLHLWLHNPMPASSLVSAKIVAGLISLLVTLILTGVTGFASFLLSKNIQVEIPLGNLMEIGFWSGVHVILLGLSFAACFLFFWMIFLMFTRTLGTFVSLLSTFVLFIVMVSLYGWFGNSVIYEKLTRWGQFELSSMLKGFSFMLDPAQAGMFTDVGQMSLFIGTYIFEAVIALILFFAACWILDRKIEV